MHPRQLLHAAIEEHEIVQELDEPFLAAHLEKILVELEARVVRLVLLPFEEILLGRSDRPVAQAFGIVPGEDDLHRAKEPLVELPLLIGEQLPDAVADGDVAVLEFDDRHRDAVDVEHEVGSPLVVAAQGHFLGNGEIVLLRLCPIDELDRLGDLARFDLHRHAVA